MRTILFCILSILFGFGASAQTSADLLKNITTNEQAAAFVQKYKNREAKLFTISARKDTADLLLPLYLKKPGYRFSFENYSYKIIAANSSPEYRVQYIYLDGTRYTKQEVDSIRTVIISMYRAGTSFVDLVATFNMDGNPTGDTFWFSEGMMVKPFETAVKKRKKGEIFTVDIPENNWYHVVLKSHDDRLVTELSILKIRNN